MEYKHGREYRAADALSRRLEDYSFSNAHPSVSGLTLIDVATSVSVDTTASFFLISLPCSSWLDILKDSYAHDHEYQQLFNALAVEGSTLTGFALHNGVLFYKGRVFLSHNSPLKPLVLQHVHDSPFGGHSGYLKTLHKVM